MNLQVLTLRRGAEERVACFSSMHEAELQSYADAVESFLSAAELVVFAGLRFSQKQQAFLLGRLVAKQALGALLEEDDWRLIDIRSGIFGQPLVRHARLACAEVTVSHSHGLAVALAYPGEWPMGIDLETVSATSAPTVLDALQASAAEQAWLASGAIDPAVACGVLWSAREALGKSMKIGLNCPLGVLSLKQIERHGPAGWAAHYTNFPQSRCVSQVSAGRVLSIALPVDVDVTPWPPMPPLLPHPG